MAWKNLSRSFLEKLAYLPIEPKRFISYNFLLIFILLLSIYIRNKYFKKNRLLMTIFFILDMIICITSVALSGFSYASGLISARFCDCRPTQPQLPNGLYRSYRRNGCRLINHPRCFRFTAGRQSRLQPSARGRKRSAIICFIRHQPIARSQKPIARTRLIARQR